MRLLLDELTRDEASAIAPSALVILPTGATEQHGPHLPAGTDRMIVEHIARAAAAEVAAEIPVVVAPTLPSGSSHHHLSFGGTLSFGTETFYRVMSDLAESLIISGFRRIFVLNGHGGSSELIQLVVRDLALKHAANLAAAPYWTIAWEALVAEQAHQGAGLPGHAGAFRADPGAATRPGARAAPAPSRAREHRPARLLLLQAREPRLLAAD